MKLKYSKLHKKWQVVSDYFEAVYKQFETKKEAEFYLESNYGYKNCYQIPYKFSNHGEI